MSFSKDPQWSGRSGFLGHVYQPSGVPPVNEHDWLLVFERPDHSFSYLMFTGPSEIYSRLEPTYQAVLAALTVPGVESGTGAPSITSVSSILPTANQRIVINGGGFGYHTPYNGNSAYIKFSDVSGNWNAGFSETVDQVNLNIAQWTNTQIVIQGFTGVYRGAWSLQPGHHIQIQVWNAQTGAGPATGIGIVDSAPVP